MLSGVLLVNISFCWYLVSFMALCLNIYMNHLGETTISSTKSPYLYLSQIATELAKKKNGLFSGALKLEELYEGPNIIHTKGKRRAL